jgi:putative nucleotidyltransferase with HDIG domain
MGGYTLLALHAFSLLQGNNIGDKIIPDFEYPLGNNVCVTDDMEDSVTPVKSSSHFQCLVPSNMDLHFLDIRSRLSVARLPAIPQVLLQLIAHCESEDAGMAALAEILANDAALSARVLRVATSSAYHCGAHPANLERALTTIGVDMVRTLLITESVYQTFNETAPASSFELQAFWKHAIATAITARFVAHKIGYAQAEEAYLGGLLHDIGRLALLAAAPEEYAVNFHTHDNPGLCALEERTLEITHAEAGAWLLERLNLDSFLADSIRYHHDPLQRLVDAHPLVRATAAADLIVDRANAGSDDISKLEELTGIPAQELQAHYKSLDAQVTAIARLLGIELTQEGVAACVTGSSSKAAARLSPDARLSEKVRDFILVSKATEGLRKLQGMDACYRGIVGAAIILFDLADAIIFTLAPSGGMLMPVSLQEGRQRLAGLRLPLHGEGIAASVGRSDGVAFHVPPRQPSVAEEQLLRFLDTDALVAVRLGTLADSPILLGAVSNGQAHHLQTRLQLLRDFGLQAGSAIAGATQKAQVESGANAAMAADFQLVSKRVAHEISNPLTVIKNYLAVLNRKAGSDRGIGTDLAILDEEIDRIAQIVNEFSSQQQLLSEDESRIDAALDYARRLFQYSESVNPGVQIEYQAGQSSLKVAMSPRKLHQILVNLIKNANEAMPDGGRIALRNRGMVQRDGRDFASLSIEDNGPGIPAEILGRLFSPVQSTKGGAHRGLGLSIVHGLVSSAEGQVLCRSGKAGTVFEILLPIAATTAVPVQPASQPEDKK